MKKLVIAVVLVGTLMASGAMAHEKRHNLPRDDGKKYEEPRGKSPEFGVWIKFPISKSKISKSRPNDQHRQWERDDERREGHRRGKDEHPRPRGRS